MNDQPDPHGVMAPTPQTVTIEEQELIHNWEFLFVALLLFGLGRLVWLYLYRPEHMSFHVGLSCGFVFSGIIWCLMRWVFRP